MCLVTKKQDPLKPVAPATLPADQFQPLRIAFLRMFEDFSASRKHMYYHKEDTSIENNAEGSLFIFLNKKFYTHIHTG